MVTIKIHRIALLKDKEHFHKNKTPRITSCDFFLVWSALKKKSKGREMNKNQTKKKEIG
jgi:hypothetical protein